MQCFGSYNIWVDIGSNTLCNRNSPLDLSWLENACLCTLYNQAWLESHSREYKVPWTTTHTKRESVTAITMDNATNHGNEVERHHDIVNIHVAHSINLAVCQGFGVRATETPLRLKEAATHFNKSTTVSNLLKEKQKLLGLKKKKLINDALEQYILLRNAGHWSSKQLYLLLSSRRKCVGCGSWPHVNDPSWKMRAVKENAMRHENR